MSDPSTDNFDGLLPDWSHIEAQYLRPGLPGVIVVRQVPPIRLFTDDGGERFGIQFADAAAVPLSRSAVETREVLIDGRRHLELAIDKPALYRTFYLLAGVISSAVVNDGQGVEVAVESALAEWRALLQEDRVLSEERQIGLFGELWALDRLLAAGALTDARAWTGPDQEVQDLRLGHADVEVKTTTGGRRVHTVTSLGQLEPSPGIPLYLLSIRLQDGGLGGVSLPHLADGIAARLGSAEAASYRERLRQAGYLHEDREHYGAVRRLADAPRLIPVDDGCPRLDSPAIAAVPATYAPDRILSVVYRIDVDGLGAPDGSPGFHNVFPPVRRPSDEV